MLYLRILHDHNIKDFKHFVSITVLFKMKIQSSLIVYIAMIIVVKNEGLSHIFTILLSPLAREFRHNS